MTRSGTVLLSNSLNAGATSLLFERPVEVITALAPDQVRPALDRLDRLSKDGLWAAGYCAYEAGFAFEERLAHLRGKTDGRPLMWFGLYKAPARLDARQVRALIAEWNAGSKGRARDIAVHLDFEGYRAAFDKVMAYIAAGDCYQVNLTFKAGFTLEGAPSALFGQLIGKQPVAHAAYVDAGDHQILSASPELFIHRQGDLIETRPMKGTLKRGRTTAEDEAGRATLLADAKTRAENLMIVDLLRNDLARISLPGSVKVTDLFTIETYRSLHQMTSGIRAEIAGEISTGDILARLFPCGSITGAPKIRAMQIIGEVEREPRGVYTGAIGHIAPNGDFSFNVAIRTAVVDANGRGEIGIGGGIVADSKAEAEYDEALLKMKFFTDPAEPLGLIETLLWERGTGYALLDRHLARLADSARYFGLPLANGAARAALEDAAQGFERERMRVRLLLDEYEGLSVTAVPLPPSPDRFRFSLAPKRTDSGNVFLFHKTTRRGALDAARKAAAEAIGVDEVVFENERGELTEGSITSLFVERGGVLLTPPLDSGLLPGTLRAELIAAGRAREAVLGVDDLTTADDIYLGNSVRGLIRAEWVRPDAAEGTGVAGTGGKP